MALGLTPYQIIEKGTHPQLCIADEWERVELKYIATVQNGYAFSSKLFNRTEGMPLIRIRDIFSSKTENLYLGEYEDEFVVKTGDILIGMDGDFKVSKWPGNNGLLNQRVCRIQFESSHYEKEFLFLCIQPYLNAIHSETSAVTVKHLSSRTISDIPFPLPPLPIQRAIVAKIEELFSDLDNGIANLKKAQAQLKVYRQAVLKKAFEGEFISVPLGQITDIRGGVTKGRKLGDKETVNLPYLRVANVQDGYLDLDVIKTVDVLPSDLDKYRLMFEDILFTEGGDRDKLGRGTVWKNEIEICIHQNHIFRARVKERDKLLPFYITYFAQSPNGKDFFFKHGKHTTNLASINKTVLSNLPIPLPSLEKQHQIVKEIESRLSVCDKVEQSITESLEKAKALRQSILKKAFEGELLTDVEVAKCKQEADYEPASVLLERIKRETFREAPGKKQAKQ